VVLSGGAEPPSALHVSDETQAEPSESEGSRVEGGHAEGAEAGTSEGTPSEAATSRVVSRAGSPLAGSPSPSAGAVLAAASPAQASAADWVSRELHREALERFVPRGARVLQVCPRGGTFTEVLQRLGCKISLASASLEELESSRSRAHALGLEENLEACYHRDISALDGIADESFDAVVAYESVLSHALERRDTALSECMRVLRPRGLLVLSVASLWGTLHRGLPAILARDLVQNRAIIRSGNAPITPLVELEGRGAASAHEPSSGGGQRHTHLFRAAELEAFLRRGGLEVLFLCASSALSTGVALPDARDASMWSALLEYERAACVERGYLDSGTHLIAVCRR
jgi:2-polyprenyl-3-methyl-5-hydroxy-6-metoxy-1,4-benzoquinol methylase